MKKKLFISYFLIMFLSLFICSSFASTNVKNRTSVNLYINKNITVNSSNKKLILDTPYVDASEKIYDFANLFTDSEEKELYDLAQNYINTKNMDLVIVTINNNNKSNSMNYADDFYDYNDFGIGANYSGIILLIDMDNRNVWISTSGDSIKLYTDSYINKMLDKIQSNLKSKNYFTGATNFIEMAIEKEYNSSNFTASERKKITIICSIIGIIISILGSSIFCGVKSAKHKPVKISTNANDYIDSSSFKVTKRDDKFVNTHTTRTARIDSSSGSSGSSGSSTHIGSSGISHGGRRKKFLKY